MKKNFFTFLPVDNGKQNWFDLSHPNSGSCNMGGLYPVLVEPTLPGDYFTCNISYLLRMAQMVAPPMSRIGVSFFAYYCPNRILMDSKDWDKFIADVDNTSGVSLPVLTFRKLFDAAQTLIDSDYPLNYLRSKLGDFFDFDVVGSNGFEIRLKDSSVYLDSSYLLGSLEQDSPELFSEFISYLESVGITPVLGRRLDYFIGDLWMKNLNSPFKGTLLDYMGFPINSPLMAYPSIIELDFTDSAMGTYDFGPAVSSGDVSFHVLPMIAYLRIWNEYFRQEFIQEEIDSELVDNFNEWKNLLSSDLSVLWSIKLRDWEHDYFTSCLPAPQLGESSSIEIGEDGKFTIPELREGNIIQRIREKLLHGGTRVWEIVANFFSERLSDSRIQIPEFIKPNEINGHPTGFSWLRISDIYQTAPGSSDSLPALDASANIAAPRGASVNTNNLGLSFNFKAEEHGYLIVLMNIQPETVYCQGLPKHFRMLDTLDYGWPDFANITEQPVYQYEVFATPANTTRNNPMQGEPDFPIFGWQSQYAWYKFHQGELHGELRDDLDFFTFARIFEEEPYLNDKFLQCNPTDRPFPISYEYDKLTYHLFVDLRVNRRLPYFGIPSLR